MKSYLQIFLSTVLAASTTASVLAVPAKPGLMRMQQPDGTELTVRLMGDEHHHFYLSEDGYLLVNDNNTFYYGNVDADGKQIKSNIIATAADKRTAAARNYLAQVDMTAVYDRLSARSAEAHEEAFEAKQAGLARTRGAAAQQNGPQRGPGLFADTRFPAMGEQKAIVILVEYQDTKFNTSYDAHDYFSRMLNEEGFSDHGGTGSARDFFIQNSNGQFVPEFDMYGPITLSKNMAYYGGNDWSGDDQHPEEMVIEACQQLDDEVDFSEYDRDGDGYIDNVFVFYAGRGEASGGSANTVWPHSWNVSSATYTPYYFDGVRLDRYACSNEWEGGRPDGVGTFVHEFSHVMGLPDLYATSYTSAFTPGSWSALDYGPYNNNGCTPPNYGAFERYALDWTEPLVIDGPLSATLNPIDTNQCGIIKTSKDNEYFLLENRQQTGWDAYIPGHGMLIWHVDYNESVWNRNTVNNSASHQYVDIEEADGTQSEYTRAGDAFPGTSHVTSFTDDTHPSMKTWSGQRLELPITDIAESADGIITFDVCGGYHEPIEATLALEAEEVTRDGFIARWESAGEEASYILNVYTYLEADVYPPIKEYLPGYQNLKVGNVTSFPVTGTVADTEYFYTVTVGNGWVVSEPSNEISVITGRLPLDHLKVEATEATDITNDGFVAHWLPLEDAESYILNVYYKEWGAPIPDGCDFSDGVNNLPEGWKSTSGASYANTAYSGEAVPSLRLSTSNDVLTTPEYPDFIRTFSMWHRGNGTSEEDMVVIECLVDGAWSVLTETPVVKEKGGETTVIDEIPEGTTQMRVSYKRTGSKGALAIDDIKVGHGMTFADIELEGLTDIEVGNVTEYEVKGLSEGTEYFYTVYAADANGLKSKKSQEISVKTTGDGSGIAEVTGAAPAIKAEGRTLMASGMAEGSTIAVYDAMGRNVAMGMADASGRAEIALPGAGIYVVSASKTKAKFIIR